jgi:hypothetical protein
VVIDKRHVVRMILAPDETDSKLVIDPYAVLAASRPTERFKAICWRGLKVFEGTSTVYRRELPHDDSLDIDPATHALAKKEGPCIGASERLDHD